MEPPTAKEIEDYRRDLNWVQSGPAKEFSDQEIIKQLTEPMIDTGHTALASIRASKRIRNG